MKQDPPPVPAFLAKLWVLVEEPSTNEFITWNQNGESFLVLDEQRFAKEILPKYFKHNNMTSFVRQLNMYGFRKVLNIDPITVKLERDEPVEFQHPYFRQGQENMLQHIKRKVASTKTEDTKVTQEDISQILSNAHKVQASHETFESRLSALQRENESLWREVGELRAKHSQQQQVIRKIVQFIVTLVQNNRLVNLKRKRTLLLNTNGPPQPNVLSQIIKEPDDDSNPEPIQRTKGLKRRGQLTDDIIIYDVTDDLVEEGEGVEDSVNIQPTPETNEDTSSDMSKGLGKHKFKRWKPVVCPQSTERTGPATKCHLLGTRSSLSHMPEIVLVEDDDEYEDGPVIQGEKDMESGDILTPVPDDTNPLLPISSQLNSSLSSLTAEDPVTMMDSILNESAAETGAVSQSMNHLGKAELMDYLDKMDCSLEDFQAMLSGRQFSIDPDLLVDLFTSSVQMNPSDFINSPKTEAKGIESLKSNGIHPAARDTESSSPKSEKQLVQYTKYPLLTELLETSTDIEPKQSKLVRLEPLTEEQASEATLFYLCELEPAPMDSDMALLDD